VSGVSGASTVAARLRVRFAKLGRVRWTSHRDVARMWERALRRGRVPVAYTAGFSPRPQISFGLALPTGCESVAEYLDLALDEEVEPEELSATVGPLLPEGVSVLAVGALAAGAASLQEEVTSCSWSIAVPRVEPEELEAAVARTTAAGSLPVQRQRKGRSVEDDLRPSVLALEAHAPAQGSPSSVTAELATFPRGVRPVELGGAMGLEFGLARRTGQWIERSGSRREPLAVATASPEWVGSAS
jgi:radical SAM-linked protein